LFESKTAGCEGLGGVLGQHEEINLIRNLACN